VRADRPFRRFDLGGESEDESFPAIATASEMLDDVVSLASGYGSLGERREQIGIGMRLCCAGRLARQAGLHEFGQGLHLYLYLLLLILDSSFLCQEASLRAKESAEKLGGADAAPEGATENAPFAVCLKAYPDTNRESFSKL
jgi:hypothetical protein